MPKIYRFLALASAALLGAQTAQAQAAAIVGLLMSGVAKSQNQFRGPAIAYRKRQYQLARGAWQSGKFYYDWQSLYVADAQSKNKKAPPYRYSVDSLRGFAMGGDTFSVVRRFTVPKTGEYVRSSFARRLYRAGAIQVLEYTDYLTGLRSARTYSLLCRPDTTIVLPTDPQELRRVAAYVVADYPALAAQLQHVKGIQPEDFRPFIETYGRWKAYPAATK